MTAILIGFGIFGLLECGFGLLPWVVPEVWQLVARIVLAVGFGVWVDEWLATVAGLGMSLLVSRTSDLLLLAADQRLRSLVVSMSGRRSR